MYNFHSILFHWPRSLEWCLFDLPCILILLRLKLSPFLTNWHQKFPTLIYQKVHSLFTNITCFYPKHGIQGSFIKKWHHKQELWGHLEKELASCTVYMYTVVQKLSLRIVWCNLKEQASHFLVLVWPASLSITIQDSSYCPWAPKQMLVKKIQPTCRKTFLTYSEYFQLTILDWYRFGLEIPLFWSVSSLVNILFFVQRILRLPGTGDP